MIRNLKQTYARYRRQRDTYETLSRLTDSELDDIGLIRADLRRFSRETI